LGSSASWAGGSLAGASSLAFGASSLAAGGVPPAGASSSGPPVRRASFFSWRCLRFSAFFFSRRNFSYE
jgi:hypothetical protein